jgi:predicted RNA-binding protein with PUA-like domain
MQYWLMKTEPDVFSISDLQQQSKSGWDGVRNYQARNFMRDQMKKGDQVLIYHSSCSVPGVAGLASISRESHPDPTCYDPKSPYYDAKSTKEKPRWFMVEIKWLKTFSRLIPLSQLKQQKELNQMALLKKGNRLSIMPISAQEFAVITALSE